MLGLKDLDADQTSAVTRLYECDATLLIAGMGSGKTVICLTAIQELISEGVLGRVLVVAPLRVATEVWATEHTKWGHLAGLRVEVATGSVAAREKALWAVSDVLVVNIENLAWLLAQGAPFDGLVIDESSRLKSSGGVAFKRLRPKLPGFTWRVCMSGTPVAENLEGLFGQLLIVDGGASLGRSKQRYLDKYFVPVDYERRTWEARKGAASEIAAAVSSATHIMPPYEHVLPELLIRQVWVEPELSEYKRLARDSVLPDVTAVNEAVLTGKLQQMASGFVYTDAEKRTARPVHSHKREAILELVRSASEPIMIVYWYRAQLWWLQGLTGARVLGEDSASIGDWNAGRVPILLAHPRACGHGLNLQAGGCRQIWLGPIWPRDLWLQTIARLWRRGQSERVEVDVIMARGTIDEIIWSRCVEGKAEWDRELRSHLG